MTSLTLASFAEALGSLAVAIHGNPDTIISAATDDSRKVMAGTLFCAIKGAKADGHDFIPQAVAKGAAAIVLQRIPAGLPDAIPYVQVSDDYRAAGIVAELAAGRPAQSFKILAVTGTNGKTTTAYLLRHMLKTAGFKTAMVGTVEYDLGGDEPVEADRTTPTPFKLQELFAEAARNGVEYCVMEMSSHALQQQRLGLAKAVGTVFTNLTQEHLDYHLTLENYYQAKKLLFTRHLAPGAPVVVNADDAFGARLAQELKSAGLAGILPFTMRRAPSEGCIQATDLSLTAGGTAFTLRLPEGEFRFASPLAGAYNGYNAAGAALLAHAIGIPDPIIAQSLAQCHGAPGRLQKFTSPRGFSVFVDYAHTPDALDNVIAAVRNITANRLIVVFGCGGDRDRTKRPRMGEAVSRAADIAIVTSDNPRTENPDAIIADILPGMTGAAQAFVVPDRKLAIARAISLATPGDSLIIAGKGHEDYQEINGVKHHFSDAESVAELL